MSARDWRPVVGHGDWMRSMEKRVGSQERRQEVRKASDLLGPGLGPYAVALDDWNSPAARFNGLWFSVDAVNAPTPTGTYLGSTVATQEGAALQEAVRHDGPRTEVWLRHVTSRISGVPLYGSWELVHPARMTGEMVQWPSAVTVPAGWLAADGSTRNAATYPDLAAVLGATGTTFVTPAGPSGTGYRSIIKT
jgi:hypothetical protein